MNINVYDPFAPRTASDEANYRFLSFPEQLETADFVVTTCALTAKTRHIINAETIGRMKTGVRIVNVSRGGIVDEVALIEALKSGKVHSAGLDVFETEPLPLDSELRQFDRCILGTHNGSNTLQGVRRASHQALKALFQYLELEVAAV
jgi:D-3-phosphoglycerate dehydrogenase